MKKKTQNKERIKKMNKIYNNLSVENLTKTDWINQFNSEQRKQILAGLKENIDVSIYAKSNFSFMQMSQIRVGLEENLDVSQYAKTEFTYQEMEEIRLKLMKESTL